MDNAFNQVTFYDPIGLSGQLLCKMGIIDFSCFLTDFVMVTLKKKKSMMLQKKKIHVLQAQITVIKIAITIFIKSLSLM